jgi:hypothetical protein
MHTIRMKSNISLVIFVLNSILPINDWESMYTQILLSE